MVASIAYIEGIIATFRQATEANLQVAGRQGNVVTIEPSAADEVMVTGDLHGHRANFNAIQRIAELDSRPHRHLNKPHVFYQYLF